jgi:hypothetical protein
MLKQFWIVWIHFGDELGMYRTNVSIQLAKQPWDICSVAVS